jgi:SAM-dependent methyltransferase
MAEAENYYRWVLRRFSPYLGQHIVEIGSGIGTFAELILRQADPQTLVLVEPAYNLFPVLRRRFAHETRVSLVNGYANDLPTTVTSDCIILVNVLEHVEDDQAFLRVLRARLVPGGRLLLLVPAGPRLFGSLDRAFGHHRRYTIATLTDSLQAARLSVRSLQYFNLPGVLSWFIAGKMLHKTTLSRRDVRVYDRWVVPWISAFEALWIPPFGQSLVAIANVPSGRDVGHES